MTILSEHDAGDGVHEMASFDDRPGVSAHPVTPTLTDFGRSQVEPVRAATPGNGGMSDTGASRFMPFSADTTQRLHALADAQGVGVGQLIRRWILDRLEAEESGRRQEQIAAELEQLARRIRASV